MRFSDATRRLTVLQRILLQPKFVSSSLRHPKNALRLSSDATKVTLGDISKEIKPPKNIAYVPHLYLRNISSQQWLKHLRWLMQKDLLSQDVFLMGPPGPLKRNLALSYLELTQREGEFLTLTRDTTDSDLKQRREIKEGTSFYHDQNAVRAAIEGRVLILEGIEKAERNVLPVLNNLLENREMQLEDGRLLIPASRYDKLLQEHSQEELDQMRLVRVSEDFRVIALGLPSPPYQGFPLDPPLRSRFQAREINALHFTEQLEALLEEFPQVRKEVVTRSLSLGHTLSSDESKILGLPDFPIDNLRHIFGIQRSFPNSKIENLIQRLYPATLFLSKEGQAAATNAFTSFDLKPLEKSRGSEGRNEVLEVIPLSGSAFEAEVKVKVEDRIHVCKVPSGNTFSSRLTSSDQFVNTAFHDQFLCELLTSHSAGDFCVVGPRGCGKSASVMQLANILGYDVEPILLYQDMTSRDLVQQRVTNSAGDTSWQFSPLITAALKGKMALLDGIHRLHHGTLAVLHRLLHDREIQLYDGTRLLRHDRYDSIKSAEGLTDDAMASRGVLRIHPSFRVVGLAEPPQIGASKGQWLTAESLSLFLYHSMRPLAHREMVELITKRVGGTIPGVEELISLASEFAVSTDSALRSLAQSISLRQIIRIAKRFQSYPQFELHTAVYKACLARFLPPLAKQALDKELELKGIHKPESSNLSQDLKCEVTDGVLRIGNTCAHVHSPEVTTKVPDTLFFSIQQHVYVLESMLQDWLLGDHLLLIGNQGVGKNKLADRFLHLLNRPREYIQLHRDTTVQSLTLQPTVKEGRIEYDDSPLVQAVKKGSVLVIDEADKAPTHVTSVLKTLVEMGEMLLSDGRRIVPHDYISPCNSENDVIVSHRDFRMIVLANRPGFPFLGNDFFGALGDLFSCHSIDNPSVESEMALLKQYGPDVSESIMRQLVEAFSELRDLADQGLIQYPYSTREVVNIIKHLQKFGDDGVASVVRNVFDFDSWSGEAKDTVVKVMHKYGIPFGASASNVKLAKRFPLPEPVIACSWRIAQQGMRDMTPLMQLSIESSSLKFKGPLNVHINDDLLQPSETRSAVFSEQDSFWALPFYETALASAVSSGLTDSGSAVIHVVTISPFALYSIYPRAGPSPLKSILLHDVLPIRRGSFTPRISIASLPNDHLAIHEEVSGALLIVHPPSSQLWAPQLDSFRESVSSSLKQTISGGRDNDQAYFRMNEALSKEGVIVLWEFGGSRLRILDVFSKHIYNITLPLTLSAIFPLSKSQFLVENDSGNKFLMKGDNGSFSTVLHSIKEYYPTEKAANLFSLTNAFSPLSDFVLSSALNQKISSPNTLFSPVKDFAAISVGFPELETSENKLYLWERKDTLRTPSSSSDHPPPQSTALLPEAGQVVRVLDRIPENFRKELDLAGNSSYLEITDLVNRGVFYLSIPRSNTSTMWNFLARDRANTVLISPMGKEGIVTVDSAGGLRLWETGSMQLDKALAEWRRMVGHDESPIRLEIEKESGKSVSAPKHGKEDPSGNPHVGGNTWAGGTGGRDTAGLGGKGGPYRLDAGHDVYQVPQWEKDAVPDEVKTAAREMGQKAFKERLREIRMSEYDASLYGKLVANVKQQIKTLRNIVSSLQTRNKERQWLRHRTDGELDDLKLIEGLAGERNVYRQRREEEPEVGAPQTKPKRLRLIVDVSGSMYRFNGHDGRLERQLEATLMVMEALEGFESKFKYDIYGHSGEDEAVPLVTLDQIPSNNKERLEVLKTMQAHSQFCLSGDNTLEAARRATKALAKEDADELFVVLLSDANLERYGIRPQQLVKALNMEPNVQSYAIFIGSLGDQADRLKKSLPAGRSFVCLDLSQLPQILQQIFTSAMLN